MNRTTTLAATATAAGVLVLAGAVPASAEGDGHRIYRQHHVLILEALEAADNSPADCSTIAWKRRPNDSPIDTNNRALVTTVCADEYADAYTGKSLVIDRPVGDVKNLSYDERSDTPGAGAPRISVILKSGDVAYLASSACSNPIGVSSTWSRADFTGETRTGFCTINVTGATGGVYTSDGINSAWGVYAAAHPEQVVSYDFLVYDEVGTYVIDRLSLGTGRLYNYSPFRAVNCKGSEARC